jgi:hypothetical protein
MKKEGAMKSLIILLNPAPAKNLLPFLIPTKGKFRLALAI